MKVQSPDTIVSVETREQWAINKYDKLYQAGLGFLSLAPGNAQSLAYIFVGSETDPELTVPVDEQPAIMQQHVDVLRDTWREEGKRVRTFYGREAGMMAIQAASDARVADLAFLGTGPAGFFEAGRGKTK